MRRAMTHQMRITYAPVCTYTYTTDIDPHEPPGTVVATDPDDALDKAEAAFRAVVIAGEYGRNDDYPAGERTIDVWLASDESGGTNWDRRTITIDPE